VGFFVTEAPTQVEAFLHGCRKVAFFISDAQRGKDKLQDMWSVKVGKTQDGKLYTAGIGVGVENTPEGMQSQVLVVADRFAILNMASGTGSAVSSPFAVEGGQVFMNSAFIKDGSITNAKIGESITSNDWVWDPDNSKTQGWAIDKRGAAWFNSAYVRGIIEAQAGYFAGELRAYNGYFGGELRGADGYFTGTVYAEKILGDVVSAGVWDTINVVGVNGYNHRYFSGGLPYDSIVVVPYVNIEVDRQGSGAGTVFIKVNGVDYWRSSANPLYGRFTGAIVINVPPNGTLDLEFGITGAQSGQTWSSGKMAVMAFRKGQNRFS